MEHLRDGVQAVDQVLLRVEQRIAHVRHRSAWIDHVGHSTCVVAKRGE